MSRVTILVEGEDEGEQSYLIRLKDVHQFDAKTDYKEDYDYFHGLGRRSSFFPWPRRLKDVTITLKNPSYVEVKQL